MRLSFFYFATALISCSSPSPKQADGTIEPTTHPVLAPNRNQLTTTFAFDVPSLLGKNIDQIETELGKPTESDTPNLTVDEMERHYHKKGYSLQIDYDTISRNVTGFIIPATEQSGGTKNCGRLIAAGNLVRTDSRYNIDSLAMPREGYYGSIVVSIN